MRPTMRPTMRLTRMLFALSAALVVLAATASYAAAQTPTVDVDGSTGNPSSFTITGTVDTFGDAADVWVYYFPMVLTTDCTAMPNPEDQMNTVQSDPVSLVAADGSRSVSVDVTGLPHETDYCYQLAVRNTASDEATSYMWSIQTTAPPPLLENPSYDSGTNSITYSVSLTANTNSYVANVDAEYFAKGPQSCDDYSGATSTDSYWGEDSNGFTGFSAQAVGTTITGLATDTTYCIRLKSNNGHADATPTAWQEVSTISPIAASVSDIALTPPSGADDANLKLTINDNGAANAQGANSDYDVYLYDVGAGRCNDQEYYGGPMVVGWSGQYAGEYEFDAGVSGLELGKPYCVSVFANSAWGNSFDTVVHQEVWFGQAPQVSAGSATSTHNSISIPGTTITPGYLATDYSIEYFPKQAAVACADDSSTPREHGSPVSISTGLDSNSSVSPTVGGLAQLTTYCYRVVASNKWASAASSWASIATKKPPVQATITNFQLLPNSLGAQLGRVHATLSDGAPFESIGETSTYSLQTFLVGQAACNTAGVDGVSVHGHTESSIDQDGSFELSWAVGNGVTGGATCVRIAIDSAWGDAYDALGFYWFNEPGPPVLEISDMSSTKSSITLTAALGATFTTTSYHLEWFEPAGADCAPAAAVVGADHAFTPDDVGSEVSATASGLQADTRYCARLVASNDWGTTNDPFEPISTTEAIPPSVPAGLAASNVTQTSAMLSWDASTDNDAVASYRVFEGATEVSNAEDTSYEVSLVCGQSRTFTVTAVDVNGNESAASAPLTVTAAACPTSPPQAPPPSTECPTKLVPFGKTVFKGKLSGKKHARAKKFTVTATSSLVGDAVKVSIKVSGIPANKVSVTFGGKKIGKTATLTTDGTLRITMPNGKKKTTKKLAVGVVGC